MMIDMTAMTTAEVATEFETNPKTLRKFLRADARDRNAGDTLPGKGSRYQIERKHLKGLRTRFNKWQAAEAAARAERAQKAAQEAQDAAEVDTDEELEVDTED